jgi:N-acetylglucosamine-6-phosphate deacetylase
MKKRAGENGHCPVARKGESLLLYPESRGFGPILDYDDDRNIRPPFFDLRGSSLHRLIALVAASVVFVGNGFLLAQSADTAPLVGLQRHLPLDYAITGDQIVTAPGKSPIAATIIIRDGRIQAVAPDLDIPSDLRVVDATGKLIYPGFIDGYSERSIRDFSSTSGYWNANVVPERSALYGFEPETDTSKKWRAIGFTARLLAPKSGQVKGTSAVISCGTGDPATLVIHPNVALHVALTTVRRRHSENYPSSPMGAVALVRQAFYDAEWYGKAWKAAAANPRIERPDRNDALAALGAWTDSGHPIIVDSSNERYFARADRLGREFSLPIIVRASGREYRRLDDVASTGRAVILPLNFPKAPAVSTPADAASATLQSLMHWDLAPENPARLAAAGVRIALTTDGLAKETKFWDQLRLAIRRGLSEETALAALTTTPADLFGVSDQLGTIEPGKAANLVIATGNLFTDKKAKVAETWIAGKRHQIIREPMTDLTGAWQLEIQPSPDQDEAEEAGVESPSLTVRLSGKPGKYKGTIATGDESEKDSVKIEKVQQADSRLSLLFDGEKLAQEGFVNVTFVVVEPLEQGSLLAGRGHWPDGTLFRCQLSKLATEDTEDAPTDADDAQPTADEAQENEAEAVAEDADVAAANETEDKADEEESEEEEPQALFDVNYPLGAYGRDALPTRAESIAFTGATIWTSGPDGNLENGTVIVSNGKITAVGTDLTIPDGTETIDATGKHISPGIIDCHSHIATDGGVNEGTQAVTCEVRIGDFIDPNDIAIYRQLAGGVTIANVLHGSANPIGGQNQVIKMRWGANGEAAKFTDAPQGVKFALGENVKQSNWGEEHTTRYPQTRMGVDELHIDAFQRAVAYRQQWSDWKTSPQGLPPRLDLELEALAEIIEGKRWIHCHSYRQSEIMALMKTCDRFGVTIGTFQHILEGYKVADEMAKRGIMGSSFSDWWAYKFEVYDAIPFNGALMHNAGVVVSFNSDDAEMGRRLNSEAAKAVRYGGVSPEEALKFVTLNPAKQLRIDARVGSIEVGKDADLVVWNVSPLSIYSRAEQTWIDGRRMFDREEDQQLQQRDRQRHAALVQKVIKSGASQRKPGEDDKNDDDLWAQADTFCHGHGHDHGE